MKKEITVRVYENLTPLKLFQIDGLEKIAISPNPKYDGIIVDGVLYFNFSIIDGFLDEEAEMTVLTNDYEIPGETPARRKTVTFDLSDGENKTDIPMFGLTIDNNLQVIQTNIPVSSASDMFKNTANGYIDYDDKSLHINGDVVSYDKLANVINIVQKNGFFAPLVLYIDNGLHVEHFDYIWWIYKMLKRNMLPVRIVCYRDINYLSRIAPELYIHALAVPATRYYSPINSKDMSEYFIINYSEKREVIRSAVKAFPRPPAEETEACLVKSEFINFDDWMPIYYFILDPKKYSVADLELASELAKAPVSVQIEGEFNYGSLRSIAATHIKEYQTTVVPKVGKLQEWMEIDLEHPENYEVYKEEKLNPSNLPIFTMSYSDNVIEEKKILKHYNADLIICGEAADTLIGEANLHNLVQRDNVVVKYIRHKH